MVRLHDLPGGPVTGDSAYASAAEALRALLSQTFIDHDYAQALDEWRDYVTRLPGSASRLLDQASGVLDDPPPDLGEILHGAMIHAPEPDEPAEQLAWVRGTLERFRSVISEFTDSPLGRVADLLERVCRERTDAEVDAEWRRYLAERPAEAQRGLEALDDFAANPPDDLTDVLRRFGWVDLHHEDAELTPFTAAESARWVADLAQRLRAGAPPGGQPMDPSPA
jgi:hypothetical protein